MSRIISQTKGGSGGGSGTVTNVSSADANATVASPTTTPVITIVTAPNLSGTPTLPNGVKATTQTTLDNSTKLATTAYADGYARMQVMNTGLAIISQNAPLIGFTAAATTSTTRIYAQLAPFLAGDVITNIVAQTRIAGAGTTPTSIVMGICDKNGAVKGVTANFVASADLTTANHITVQALASPFTIPTSDVYYLWWQAIGTWGTTQMSLAVQSNTAGIMGGPVSSGFAATATTTLGTIPTTSTTFTLVSPANTSAYWMAAS